MASARTMKALLSTNEAACERSVEETAESLPSRKSLSSCFFLENSFRRIVRLHWPGLCFVQGFDSFAKSLPVARRVVIYTRNRICRRKEYLYSTAQPKNIYKRRGHWKSGRRSRQPLTWHLLAFKWSRSRPQSSLASVRTMFTCIDVLMYFHTRINHEIGHGYRRRSTAAPARELMARQRRFSCSTSKSRDEIW